MADRYFPKTIFWTIGTPKKYKNQNLISAQKNVSFSLHVASSVILCIYSDTQILVLLYLLCRSKWLARVSIEISYISVVCWWRFFSFQLSSCKVHCQGLPKVPGTCHSSFRFTFCITYSKKCRCFSSWYSGLLPLRERLSELKLLRCCRTQILLPLFWKSGQSIIFVFFVQS